VERLILDTGVLINGARGIVAIPDTADAAIPAVVIAEYLAGVHRSATNRQAAQRAFLADVLGVVPVVDYDRNVAEHHAELLAYTHAQGQRRGPHDLMIAATARASGRTILTTDTRARFDDLPEVNARIAARKPSAK
jgi:tRNA(fMet)-specific endonuclease VapC